MRWKIAHGETESELCHFLRPMYPFARLQKNIFCRILDPKFSLYKSKHILLYQSGIRWVWKLYILNKKVVWKRNKFNAWKKNLKANVRRFWIILHCSMLITSDVMGGGIGNSGNSGIRAFSPKKPSGKPNQNWTPHYPIPLTIFILFFVIRRHWLATRWKMWSWLQVTWRKTFGMWKKYFIVKQFRSLLW